MEKKKTLAKQPEQHQAEKWALNINQLCWMRTFRWDGVCLWLCVSVCVCVAYVDMGEKQLYWCTSFNVKIKSKYKDMDLLLLLIEIYETEMKTKKKK